MVDCEVLIHSFLRDLKTSQSTTLCTYIYNYDLVTDLALPSIVQCNHTLKKPVGRNVCIKHGPVSGLQLTSFFIQLIYIYFKRLVQEGHK